MKKLRDAGEGCGFSTIDRASGGRHIIALHAVNSPLKLRRISTSSSTHIGAGKAVEAKVTGFGLHDTIRIDCWIPSDMSADEFTAAVMTAQRRGTWKAMEHALQRSPLVAPDRLGADLSKEGQVLKYELTGSRPTNIKATKSTLFQCIEPKATDKAQKHRANFDISVWCTCASVDEGKHWSCIMQFDDLGGNLVFDDSDGSWDGWVDCDMIGCVDSGGTGPDSVAVRASAGLVTVDDPVTFTSSGPVDSWSFERADNVTEDPGCATHTCMMSMSMSGTMSVYGNYTSASVYVAALPLCTDDGDEALADQMNADGFTGAFSGLVLCSDAAFQSGRMRLPPVGAFLRRLACRSAGTPSSSDLCQHMFERFWARTDGCSDYTLSTGEFGDLKFALQDRIGTLANITTGSYPNGAVKRGTISSYNTPYYTTFGTLTVYLDAQDNIVGMFDGYDFNTNADRTFWWNTAVAGFRYSLPHDGSGNYQTCSPDTGFKIKYP